MCVYNKYVYILRHIKCPIPFKQFTQTVAFRLEIEVPSLCSALKRRANKCCILCVQFRYVFSRWLAIEQQQQQQCLHTITLRCALSFSSFRSLESVYFFWICSVICQARAIAPSNAHRQRQQQQSQSHAVQGNKDRQAERDFSNCIQIFLYLLLLCVCYYYFHFIFIFFFAISHCGKPQFIFIALS